MNLRSFVPALPGVFAAALVAPPAHADPPAPRAPAEAAPLAPLAAERPPPPDPQPPKIRSRGMLIGGLAATIGGVGLLVWGGIMYATDTSPNPCTPSVWFCGLGRGIGTALMIPGAVSAAIGLPLAIVGGSPRTTSTAAIRSWAPSVGVGPGAASLRWTF